MEIVKPGTLIITKIGSIKAVITAVCIRNESISYEISWFAGGDHKLTWIYRYEFDIDTSVITKPGFKSFQNEETEFTLIQNQ